MTGMDMPWSGAAAAAAAAALGAGEPSTKSCLGGLTLQNTENTFACHIVDLGLVTVNNNNNKWPKKDMH